MYKGKRKKRSRRRVKAKGMIKVKERIKEKTKERAKEKEKAKENLELEQFSTRNFSEKFVRRRFDAPKVSQRMELALTHGRMFI